MAARSSKPAHLFAIRDIFSLKINYKYRLLKETI
jgi:hypothetical protein